MSVNENDRPDLQLENDRMLNERPPVPYTRWEDYYAAQESQRKPFKKLEECQKDFEAHVRTLIQDAIADGHDSHTVFDAGQFSLSLWMDCWPGSQATDQVVDALGLELGLEIQWENSAAPDSDKADLVFWWE